MVSYVEFISPISANFGRYRGPILRFIFSPSSIVRFFWLRPAFIVLRSQEISHVRSIIDSVNLQENGSATRHCSRGWTWVEVHVWLDFASLMWIELIRLIFPPWKEGDGHPRSRLWIRQVVTCYHLLINDFTSLFLICDKCLPVHCPLEDANSELEFTRLSWEYRPRRYYCPLNRCKWTPNF